MKVWEKATGNIATAMDWDDLHYLTDDDKLLSTDEWKPLIQHMPRYHNTVRANVHMNGAMAAPIPTRY